MSTSTSTPSANSPATTTSRSTTRDSQDEIVRRIEVGTVTFQPPPSRFITAAVPANNFGVNASFDVRAAPVPDAGRHPEGKRQWPSGSTPSARPPARHRTGRLRDLDFEAGRFFWVVDPDSVPGYPAIDILNLIPPARSAAYRPTEVRIYRYRAARGTSGSQSQPRRHHRARPERIDRDQSLRAGALAAPDPGHRLLPRSIGTLVCACHQAGPERLPRRQLPDRGRNDRSAASPEVDQGPGSSDCLRLIVEPQREPDAATFRYEMRQIYRVAGADLDRPSLAGQHHPQSLRAAGQRGGPRPTSSLLGLAVPTDQDVFDRENRLFPRSRDPEAATGS